MSRASDLGCKHKAQEATDPSARSIFAQLAQLAEMLEDHAQLTSRRFPPPWSVQWRSFLLG
jgi:hypothetical protein